MHQRSRGFCLRAVLGRERAPRLVCVFALSAVIGACDGAPSEERKSAPKAARESPATGQAPAATPPVLAPAEKAELGKPAPDFSLPDTDGKTVRLSDLRGKTVVLEWFNPDCPFVKHAHSAGPLKNMASQHAGPELVWLSINSNAPGKQGHGKQRNLDAKAEYRMTNPVLLDEAGQVGKAYGAEKTPHMFVIDPAGILVYRGGLDNAPMGVPDDARPRPSDKKPGELVPYTVNALADLKAGRAVALAETPVYGCTVKYGD